MLGCFESEPQTEVTQNVTKVGPIQACNICVDESYVLNTRNQLSISIQNLAFLLLSKQLFQDQPIAPCSHIFAHLGLRQFWSDDLRCGSFSYMSFRTSSATLPIPCIPQLYDQVVWVLLTGMITLLIVLSPLPAPPLDRNKQTSYQFRLWQSRNWSISSCQKLNLIVKFLCNSSVCCLHHH